MRFPHPRWACRYSSHLGGVGVLELPCYTEEHDRCDEEIRESGRDLFPPCVRRRPRSPEYTECHSVPSGGEGYLALNVMRPDRAWWRVNNVRIKKVFSATHEFRKRSLNLPVGLTLEPSLQAPR